VQVINAFGLTRSLGTGHDTVASHGTCADHLAASHDDALRCLAATAVLCATGHPAKAEDLAMLALEPCGHGGAIPDQTSLSTQEVVDPDGASDTLGWLDRVEMAMYACAAHECATSKPGQAGTGVARSVDACPIAEATPLNTLLHAMVGACLWLEQHSAGHIGMRALAASAHRAAQAMWLPATLQWSICSFLCRPLCNTPACASVWHALLQSARQLSPEHLRDHACCLLRHLQEHAKLCSARPSDNLLCAQVVMLLSDEEATRDLVDDIAMLLLRREPAGSACF
jgi:hypothetical protein